ncbi:MAG: single-stranded-DNA-specific exonuclease RecJ [Pseudoflavonifractor sp.]|nr:single-stranded-DNA-specific exonuclease RecJ [Pseudoflavonifractor sp.]
MKYRQWNEIGPHREEKALRAAGIPALCAKVLAARGWSDAGAASRFLFEESPLLDPMEMADMDRAAARLRRALETGETIAVYGDYDVDGITATCLMTDFLRSEGGTVLPYIPNRLEEGYGLNRGAVEQLAARGASLVVTVDCGITAVVEAAVAAALGVDVVITDHHECKDTLPAAAAVVDPHRPDCPYPFKSLAGVGVALKVCMALAGPARQEELLNRYADLCALGTVADVMELTDENRTIVRRGLAALSRTWRPGLRALLREAGAEGRALSSISIGYTLAPRINAAGRMGRAEVAESLLLTDDPARAEALARELCELNRQRQELEAEIFAQCDLLVDTLPAGERDALVLAGNTWHQGVVGIVASRLTEKYAVPTFMICIQQGKGKGSCRSYGGLNLFSLLEGCTDLLESYGGHELAAGFTIREENIALFRTRVNALTRAVRAEAEPATALAVDCVLDSPEFLTIEEVEGLSLLEPYGPGNPKPVFRLDRCAVAGLTQVGNGKHMKLKLSVGGRNLDAIFFSATAEEAGIAAADRVDVCFYPQINEYRNWRAVQLQLCDLRPARTRAQAEDELFHRLMEGGELSRAEAVALLPTRQEFANLWRYLCARQSEGFIEDTAQRLARNVARTCGLRETFMRTQVCLAVFHDKGLVRVERTTDHLRIQVRDTGEKVDLESCTLMRQLRRLAEEP